MFPLDGLNFTFMITPMTKTLWYSHPSVYVNPYQAHNLKQFLQNSYKVTFYVVHNRVWHRLNTVCGCNEKLQDLLQNSTVINQSNTLLLTNDTQHLPQHEHDTSLDHVETQLDCDPTYATVKYKRVRPNWCCSYQCEMICK